MALTVGTTAALRVVTDTPSSAVPDGLWRYRVDVDHYLTGGATSEGGNIFQWAKATLALDAIDIDAELAQRKADSHGLTALPLLAGERSPGWWAKASGSVIGLRLSTTPLDIVQALLEGVALRLALIADQLADNAVQVMASGGALSASPVWTQMIANALNRPLHVIETTETTARGVAIMVLSALDKRGYGDFPALATHIVEPQAEAVEALKAARKRQESLYRTMISG
jgi:gluconokinase